MDDREQIERQIGLLHAGLGTVRESMARVEVTLTRVADMTNELVSLRRDLTAHEVHDAATHGALQTDLRRSWWLLGLLVAALVGLAVQVVGGHHGGA